MADLQGSAAWREARKALITSTDLPVILGLSPYKSEATLARQKLGQEADTEQNLPMKIGLALEPLLKAEYEARFPGVTLRRYHGLVKHPGLPWAAASPDWRRQGEKYLVEGKTTSSRRWDDAELPRDVEAQVRWAMGCTGFPIADVAALVHYRDLRVVTVEHDPELFEQLVTIAVDFRHRLANGGPFAEDKASLRSRYPQDDGDSLEADAETVRLVQALLAARGQREAADAAAEELENQIKTRMATAAKLRGPGFTISWKRTKDLEEVNWKNLADGLLRQLPDGEREVLLGLNTTVKPGFRPFRVAVEKEAAE